MQPRIHLAFWAASTRCQVMVELLFDQHPQVLLLRAALSLFFTLPVFVLEVA